MTTVKPKGPIPLRTIMAFSLATAPVGALSTPLLVNLPPYYAGLLGLSLAAVGLIFGAVKLPLAPDCGGLAGSSLSESTQATMRRS